MNKSLVNGLILAGNPCPFLDNCKFKCHHCPTAINLKTSGYSCAAARLHEKLLAGTPVEHEVRKTVDNP